MKSAAQPAAKPIAARSAYQRREPEKTLLYQTIQNHISTFFAQCEASQHAVPPFVRKEFEAYLRCGILAHGFARVYCQECRFDRLVAFSCKRRGFCPSCMARRMAETAAHLVDSVIPEIPTRQWVLSIPAPLRYLLAYDSKALSFVANTFVKTVFSWLRKKAKKKGAIERSSVAYPGAVTFVQRFGSALNLNVHLHCTFSDGIFIKRVSGAADFCRLPAPTLEEIREITTKVAFLVHRWLIKRMGEVEHDAFPEKEPLLASCYNASIRYLAAIGPRSGLPLMRVFSEPPEPNDERETRTVAGFNLHVSIPVEGDDRRALERQLRYMGRPPLSEERLTATADGKLIVRLKSPWRDGTSSIVISPLELIERLVALIPPPRKNMIRYHGIFGPNAKLRSQIVPKKEGEASANQEDGNHPKARKGWAWARLIARVFEIDVLECPLCKSRMQTIAFVTEPGPIRDILASLKMSTAPPDVAYPLGHARANIEFEQVDFSYDYAQ